METALTRMLDLQYPIIQAPMAGGPTTPELIAAVSNAGGLGSLGAGYLTPDQTREAIKAIKQLTERPFCVNLFVPEQPNGSSSAIAEMNGRLNRYRAELGIDPNPPTPASIETFEEQVQVLLDERVPIVSFTFGIPSLDILHAMQQRGVIVIGTATTVEEGMQLEAAGVDAIVAQGSEAGGHRGTFLTPANDALIGTMALIPQMVDRVTVPVIAAGGIMDGRGLVASLALGASAVQMGTAFLACPESGAHAAYKSKILSSREDSTDITYAFSGKAARGIRNHFMNSMRSYPGTIPAYPVQNTMTRDIRQAAAKANNPAYMSLWAGQGTRLATERGAADVVKQTIEQASALISSMKKAIPKP
ncbi:2-nitropropane dioxygenase NPD [Paenibacillus curdlanolyticus YK9]|uniref:Probable nitronate monooxygenase n=1 Tax=Paenibacillus curdlanolyticus YK9 TaxID=717606 RepID=E0I7V9_9BACL|nr:nitronate monooxygenase [Paenibacillus curdlanolyticus]EFM11264.1 2-nitropropane dioxygenase NPD [Paenibacillus curdlanolyticus YK9]